MLLPFPVYYDSLSSVLAMQFHTDKAFEGASVMNGLSKSLIYLPL